MDEIKNLPKGALLQKNGNRTYVFFPQYYYDKEAGDGLKGKQKRRYIGSVKDGAFVPNEMYRLHPEITRTSPDPKESAKADKTKEKTQARAEEPTKKPEEAKPLRQTTYDSHVAGATLALESMARECHVREDLEKHYGKQVADQVLSLAYFSLVQGSSAFYLAADWTRSHWTPATEGLSSSNISRLLTRLGDDEDSLNRFFASRHGHYAGKEYFSFDSTKIATDSTRISDVKVAPAKTGQYQSEIGLAVLCSHKTRMPIMFRVLPGNMVDVKTLKDLVCRWQDLGISSLATAVLDRGYNSQYNMTTLCRNEIPFVMAQSVSKAAIRDAIDKNLPKFWESRHYVTAVRGYAVTVPITLKDVDEAGKPVPGGAKHKVYAHIFRRDQSSDREEYAIHRDLEAYQKLWAEGKADPSHPLRQFFLPHDGLPGESRLETDFGAVDAAVVHKGFFCIVSNTIKDATAVLDIYRSRDCVEKTFSRLGSGLDFDSVGVHSDAALRGKLLLSFVSLSVLAQMVCHMEAKGDDGRRLIDDMSVNEVLMALGSIKLISSPKRPARLSEIVGKEKALLARLRALDFVKNWGK